MGWGGMNCDGFNKRGREDFPAIGHRPLMLEERGKEVFSKGR